METQIVNLIKKGKIGVLPTDTIYGIVGSALNPKTVEEIYTLRKRDISKPLIILIAGLNDLNKFHINLTKEQKEFLKKVWPNPVSVILACPYEEFTYLHRGRKSLAFRIPDNKMLLNILKEVGPMVAPSANLEKEKPAETIEEAKRYFKDEVSFYIDGGKIESKPSTIIRLYEDGKSIILRKGTHKLI